MNMAALYTVFKTLVKDCAHMSSIYCTCVQDMKYQSQTFQKLLV